MNDGTDLWQQDVFVSREDGFHTYRIPAVIVSQAGTVLAFCEGRKGSRADHGEIHLLLKRSFDGGRTWGDAQVVWKDQPHTIGNPCPVVDRETGTIWLPFCRNNDRVFVTHSRDDGATWAAPVEITEDVKQPGWDWYATGPCHGLQLAGGRMVIPCNHGQPEDATVQQSHVFASDDHGQTWKLAGVLGGMTDECVAVQLDDGSVYLNMRSNRPRTGHRRLVAYSRDEGQTWTDPVEDAALVEPVCQGSALRVSDLAGGPDVVLFSNPADTERRRMTVRISRDQCRTWSDGCVLHEGPSAYSDLAQLADGTILCLYERGFEDIYDRLTVARVTMERLEQDAAGQEEPRRA